MVDFYRILGRNKKKEIFRNIEDASQNRSKLRRMIQANIREFKTLENRLSMFLSNLKTKDRFYYTMILETLKVNDARRARLYAKELVEVRKGIKSINYARIALEQISMRLSTVNDVGDFVAILAPAMFVIKSINKCLNGVLPQAESEFDSISDAISGVLFHIGHLGEVEMNFSMVDEEADKILRRAEIEVEREMIEKLPPVPRTIEESPSRSEGFRRNRE